MITNAIITSLFGTDDTTRIIIFILKIIELALEFIIMMRIFKKAGENPIFAWVPLLNKATLLKISGMNPWWIIVIILSMISIYIGIIPIVLILEIINLIVFEIILKVKLSNKFRMKPAFAVGLMICPIIFYGILAYGNARYISNWGLKSKE